MKRFAVALLSILLVLLSGCTKPVTESAESGTVESIAEDLSGAESGAEKAETTEHVTQTLSSGVMIDADVYVPEAMRKECLPEMQGTGQEIDFEKMKEIFCAGKTITEETESTFTPDRPGALNDSDRYVYTEDGDYLMSSFGNVFVYSAARNNTTDVMTSELYKTGEDLDFATIAEADEEIRKVAEELGVSVGDSVCYTMDTSSMPHYVFEYDLLVNGLPLGKFDGGSYSGSGFMPGTSLTAMVDADGIFCFEVMYVLKETETGDAQRVLTLNEAIDKVDEKYNSIIMEGDYEISDIQMAYTPIKTDDAGGVRMIPVWYFKTTHVVTMTNRSGTGQVTLPQDGYILINALDGTELLHGNGEI